MTENTGLWEAVDRLLDRAPGWDELRVHRVHLLAARRWRSLGRAVPPDVEREEELAAATALTAPVVLARVRDALDGPIVVLKGPDIAACYPAPELRTFIDIDLLVPEPERAQAALLAAGFEEADDPPWAFRRQGEAGLFANKHHVRPLFWPSFPLRIELHRRPSWPRWLEPPPAEPLLAEAVPSACGVPGVLTLAGHHHALVLAAHSWVHEPLGRLRDLLDVAVMADGEDRSEVDRAARAWSAVRLWRATIGAADAALDGRRLTIAQHVWARNVPAMRPRTVVESHLENWISCFWTLPPRAALRRAASNILWDLRPAVGEPWRAKLRRTARALGNALSSKSEHDRDLGLEARQMHPPERWQNRDGSAR